MKHLRLLSIIAALAVSAPAGTAAAASPLPDLPSPSDPAFLVPEGKVEHTVTVEKVFGTRAVPRHERTERWLTRTHARTVVADVRTGRVLREITHRPGESRVFDRATNTIRILRDRALTGPPWNAASFEAAVQKAYVEQGAVRVVGEVAVAGHRALVVENAPPRWRSDTPDARTLAVVDAETFHLYQRTTSDRGLFTQDTVYAVCELLDAGARVQARLAMAEHKGARITRKATSTGGR
jgi:hypothetical protein